jgi:hypothetical protein
MRLQLQAASAADIQHYNSNPPGVEELISPGGPGLSVEKAWHGLHRVLTGEAWGGDAPLGFLLIGGSPVGDDLGYGPARLFGPEEAIDIANALDAISDEEFDRRFDLEQLAAEQIYPMIWDEPRPNLLQEYLHYFHELRQFVRDAARQRMGLLVFLS